MKCNPRHWCSHNYDIVKITAAAVTITLFSFISPSVAADPSRLVVAINPPRIETNRYWMGANWDMLGPAIDRLVGNDPLTGEYTN